jgi:hypothetical protein
MDWEKTVCDFVAVQPSTLTESSLADVQIILSELYKRERPREACENVVFPRWVQQYGGIHLSLQLPLSVSRERHGSSSCQIHPTT